MPFNLKNLYHIIHIQRISERLWRVFYLKHFCILGFAQKETISLIHDTLCAWCYRTRNEKIFLRVQEQKIFQVQILFSFNSTHIFRSLLMHSNKHAIVSKNVYNFLTKIRFLSCTSESDSSAVLHLTRP